MKEFYINIAIKVKATDMEDAYEMLSWIKSDLKDFDYVTDVLENDVEEL